MFATGFTMPSAFELISPNVSRSEFTIAVSSSL